MGDLLDILEDLLKQELTDQARFGIREGAAEIRTLRSEFDRLHAIVARMEDLEGVLKVMRSAWAWTGSGTVDAAVVRMARAVRDYVMGEG